MWLKDTLKGFMIVMEPFLYLAYAMELPLFVAYIMGKHKWRVRKPLSQRRSKLLTRKIIK